jgi:hypothetical protein
MMKVFFLKSAALAFLASVALSAVAKPSEIQVTQGLQLDNRPNSNLLAATGTATTAVSGLADRPVSTAKPRRR